MKKRLLYAIVGLLIVLFATIGISVALNAYDPPLDPEVRRIIYTRYTPTENERDAYFYLLGLYTGETTDPQKKGEEHWKKWAGESPADGDHEWWSKLRENNPWHTSFSGCGRTVCEVSYLNDHPDALEWLTKDRDKLDRYIHLLSYGSTASMFEAQAAIPFGEILKIHIGLHRLLLLQFSAWAKAGEYAKLERVMTDANRYARSVLGHGTLLEIMMAAADIQWDAEFLDAEMKRNPKLKISKELAESFVLPNSDQVIEVALDYEMRYFASLLKNIRREFGELSLETVMAEDASNTLRRAFPATWFFRPNETLNNYRRLTIESLHTTCPAGEEAFSEMRCLPTYPWLMPPWPGPWLINPVGRLITRVMVVQVSGRYKTLEKRLSTIHELQRKFAGEFDQK